MKYRVNRPFVAIQPRQGGVDFITIPAGSVIELRGEVQESGLVDIMHGGAIAAAFLRDIEERADPLEGGTAAGA